MSLKNVPKYIYIYTICSSNISNIIYQERIRRLANREQSYRKILYANCWPMRTDVLAYWRHKDTDVLCSTTKWQVDGIAFSYQATDPVLIILPLPYYVSISMMSHIGWQFSDNPGSANCHEIELWFYEILNTYI